MPLVRRWFLLILAVALPGWVRGDGKVIPPMAFQVVQIPDQRALIHFQDGRETLVIETSFEGDGSDFAWVVPVPTRPEVKAISSGLFNTLPILTKANF